MPRNDIRQWNPLMRPKRRLAQIDELAADNGVTCEILDNGKTTVSLMLDDQPLVPVYSGKHLGFQDADGNLLFSTVPQRAEDAETA